MSRRIPTGQDVYKEAVQRMRVLYAEDARVVVSFSGGKDSTVLLNVCAEAAEAEGRGPVEVMAQDEEVAYPGTYEFWERTAARPDVDFNWLVCGQPMVNLFNRPQPYWWTFDSRLQPSEWVREPPEWATWVRDINIEALTNPTRFPVQEGQRLIAAIGLRTSESRGRMYGIHSSKGYLTKPNRLGVTNARPVYDWSDGDVWKAILDHGWDYNEAYDVFARMGVKKTELRIGPPTMTAEAVDKLDLAWRAWPQWFDKVCKRLPGIRTAALYGKRAVLPDRRSSESWEACFQRTCIHDSPEWIQRRAKKVRDVVLHLHARHATAPLPEVSPCHTCPGNLGSWKRLTLALYSGDPFCTKTGSTGRQAIGFVEPEQFRDGAGTWGGTPTW